MRHPESRLQEAVALLLDLHGWRWCHVPNEGKRGKAEAARLKGEGVKAGVPDALVFEAWDEGFGVAIELKAGRNKPTAEQEKWLADLEERGWLTGVARSVDEAQAILRLVRPVNGRRMR